MALQKESPKNRTSGALNHDGCAIGLAPITCDCRISPLSRQCGQLKRSRFVDNVTCDGHPVVASARTAAIDQNVCMSRHSPRSRRTLTGSRRKRRTVVLAALVVVAMALGFGTYRLIPSRTTQLAGELVQRVETAERIVALTFDDGPTAADADAVLEALAQRGVVATFYLNGQDIEANPEAMQAIIAGGHEIGNHTWSHRSMAFVTSDTVAEEVESTDAAIRAAGYEGPITFRPPYGNKLLTLPLYLAQHDRLTVTWDVSSEDFSVARQSSSEIVDGTVEMTSPGSIILLHPWFGRTSTQQAIGEVIDLLQAQGYRFVTVSALIDGQR